MSALMNGMSNKIAAHSFSLSVRTIEMHRANALAKLECKSIAEAIHIANDAGVALAARTPNTSEVRSIQP